MTVVRNTLSHTVDLDGGVAILSHEVKDVNIDSSPFNQNLVVNGTLQVLAPGSFPDFPNPGGAVGLWAALPPEGRLGQVPLPGVAGQVLVSNDPAEPGFSSLTGAGILGRSEMGAPNGVATLDTDGLILDSQLPALALGDTFVAASDAEQLALVTQRGDTVIRTDTSKSYVRLGTTTGTMADYQELLSPSDHVLSVNGQVGSVDLLPADLGISDHWLNEFGAVEGGVLDATPVIQDLLDAGGHAIIPPGDYLADSAALIWPTDGSLKRLTIYGRLLAPTWTGSLLRISGTTTGTTLLAADLAVGATSAAVVVPGVAAGDWVRVGSNAYYAGIADDGGGGGVDQYIGERVRVLSVVGGTVNFEWPLIGGPYNVADGAFIQKFNDIADVTIDGPGSIEGGDESVLDQWAISVSMVERIRISGISLLNFDALGIQLSNVVDAVVDGVTLDAGQSSNDTGAYGISIVRTASDVTVANSTFRNYRHGVNTSGGSSTADVGICRRVSYLNNNVIRARAAGLTTHAGVEDAVVIGNKIYQSTGGIAIRNPRAVVVGNTISGNSTYGLQFDNESTQPTAWIVSGNLIDKCGNDGIRVFMSTPTSHAGLVADGISIIGNVVSEPGGHGIYVLSTLPDRIRNVVMDGNVIRASTGSGVRVEFGTNCHVSNTLVNDSVVSGITFSACVDSTIKNNSVYSATGNGIVFSGVTTGCSITLNRVKTTANDGISLSSSSSGCNVRMNDATGSTPPITIAGTGHVVKDNLPISTSSVASTAALTLPETRDAIIISGTNDITSITASWRGRLVWLHFSSTAIVRKGGNIKIAQDFPGGPDRVLLLYCDGTNWMGFDTILDPDTTLAANSDLRGVSQKAIKAYVDALAVAVAAGYQPLNGTLTAFAALAPSNDDFLQRKAGAWTNRTVAQVKTDLAVPPDMTGVWETMAEAEGRVPAASTTSNKLFIGSGGAVANSGSQVTTAPSIIAIRAADMDSVSGKSLRLRIKAAALINAVSPGVDFRVGLYPVTAGVGASGGVTYTLSAPVVYVDITPPDSDEGAEVALGAGTIPDGLYVLGVTPLVSATAASSEAQVTALLQKRFV